MALSGGARSAWRSAEELGGHGAQRRSLECMALSKGARSAWRSAEELGVHGAQQRS